MSDTKTNEPAENETGASPEAQAEGEKEKNPYAFRRNVSAVVTLASLGVYLLMPDKQSVAAALVMVAFFVLIMVVTYFQQQCRAWITDRRNPEAYDSDGRYHKEWENGRPEEPKEHKNAPNRNQKNRGKKKKNFNR